MTLPTGRDKVREGRWKWERRQTGDMPARPLGRVDAVINARLARAKRDMGVELYSLRRDGRQDSQSPRMRSYAGGGCRARGRPGVIRAAWGQDWNLLKFPLLLLQLFTVPSPSKGQRLLCVP